ncbi:DUF2637 domain-containing protein [Streptomyces anulatus]|uniref:DUF2637 domain-containing protein n=2 Tax=Streptomyces TaxID=1883 RepID=UPI0022589323|nr:DUF2637 domain-containing protein [Streptomyces anulatus]MCX4489896.1 DUF2637 domain-containing protein [Streptomyces anulatus]
MAAMQLTRTHRILIGVVIAGAVLIAAIGFAGSYAAVRELAEDKGFGRFSLVFPIGIDAGICVLLALDLLLTWMRIPFPLLRQTAWLLTAATIAFNGAASWPDPLGTAMHAVIPVLFVVSVEAARHAVGRIADITADKHMEGVRLTRWLLSPVPTFKLWRRMKLWELRSYEQVIKLEQDRLIYQARLQARFGRNWRRKAPVEAMMPLRLAKYGVPLAETAPAGLAAAGIEEPVLATVERIDTEGTAPALPIGQHSGEPAAEMEGPARAGHQESPVAVLADAVHDAAPAQPVLPDVDYLAAAEGYAAQNGGFPGTEQFALFLAQYGVVDSSTGRPLSESLLDPVLDELWINHAERFTSLDLGTPQGSSEAAEPTDSTPVEVLPEDGPEPEHEPVPDPVGTLPGNTGSAPRPDSGGEGGPAGAHSSFESTTPEPVVAPAAGGQVAEPVAAPSAAHANEARPGGTAAEQTALDVQAARPTETPGESARWEATVTDGGVATARLPEQQTEEPELDPAQQQIVTVADWLAEAEEGGGKLSGAEVARRLGLSPRTGQRRLDKAAEYLAEQRRQQGRAHLRSVRS